MTGSRWLAPAGAGAGIDLVCLPHAGGGAAPYRGWPAHAGLRMRAVQLPGREVRIGEPPCTSMEALVDALVAQLEPVRVAPYVLFGHSMGALIAYRLCCALQERGLALPLRLFVSASRPPQRPRATPWHDLPEAAFIERVLALGGTPAEVFEHPMLRPLALGLLRADFALAEGCLATPVVLACPITALAGSADRHVPASELDGWRELTDAGFDLALFEGDHFFLRRQGAAIQALIARRLGPGAAMPMTPC